MSNNSSLVWTADMEVSLFYSMIDHKPVGENKNFHMIFIYEKFNNMSEKKLSIEQLWAHLNTLYDLKELDDNEVLPFPNDEEDFCLPESFVLKSPNGSECSTRTTCSSSRNDKSSTNNQKSSSSSSSSSSKSASNLTPQAILTSKSNKKK